MKFLALGFVGLITACDAERKNVQADGAREDTVADSLVLTLEDGSQVWLTPGMVDTSATGEVCRARSIEIRRRDSVIPVPLLYTMAAPERETDSTLRASLARDCKTVDPYRVNIRTGQPERIR